MKTIPDPLERTIAEALDKAGIEYLTDFGGGNPSGLDFRLDSGIEIEVKRFHSPRIATQMARANNVIAVQGAAAVAFMAECIAALKTARLLDEISAVGCSLQLVENDWEGEA